jgi:molybdopterin molybdotransferase
MLSVEAALSRILDAVPRLGSEVVPIGAALGRVLAEPVVSTRDLPGWDNASMDGYALRAADVGAAAATRPIRLQVVGEVPAGTVASRPAAPGEAYRILTGAPMPPGTDAVVPQEDVVRDGDGVVIARPVGRGDFVRPRGEDIRAGDGVLAPGTLLYPAALGVLSALGWARVRVHQRPRVAVLSTGDELVEGPGPLSAGQVPNSNTAALSAQILEAGGVPLDLGIARDRPEELEERLRWGLAADVLVSSAGVSVGDRDYVRSVAARLGADLDFWQVDMRPGKPITFGRVAGRPFFGLPGNPVSCMVTFELFVRPALRRMMGLAVIERPRVVAEAGARLDNPGSRRGYLRVRLAREGNRLVARPTGEQGSGILRSMLLADGLAVVGPDVCIMPGQPVEVVLLRHDL